MDNSIDVEIDKLQNVTHGKDTRQLVIDSLNKAYSLGVREYYNEFIFNEIVASRGDYPTLNERLDEQYDELKVSISNNQEIIDARMGKPKLVDKISEMSTKINEVVAGGTGSTPSTLRRYAYVLTATTAGQKAFTIPLSIFDATTDTLFIVQNRTSLNNTDYTIADKIITLTEGVTVGTEISIVILKNVPVGQDGSLDGNTLAVNSTDANRLKDNTLEWKKMSQVMGQNLLQNGSFLQGMNGWNIVSGSTNMSWAHYSPLFGYGISSESDVGSGWWAIDSKTIEVHSTATVILSWDMGGPNMYCQIRDANTNALYATEFDLKTTGGRNYVKWVNNTGGNKTVKVRLVCNPGSKWTFIKNIKFELGASPVPTPYSVEGDVLNLSVKQQITPTLINGFQYWSPDTDCFVSRLGNVVYVNMVVKLPTGSITNGHAFSNTPFLPSVARQLVGFVLMNDTTWRPVAINIGTSATNGVMSVYEPPAGTQYSPTRLLISGSYLI